MLSSVMLLIFAAASGCANAIAACAMKGAQNAECRIVSFGTVSMAFAALLAFIFMLFLSGTNSDFQIWLFGITLGILMSSAIGTTVLANKEGPPSLVWSMANLGLIVPIVLAAIFHNEPLRMTDMFLIGNFILMLWMFKHGMSIANDFSDNAHPWRYIALLIAVFLCNGLLMFGFKLNEMLHPANKACFVAAFYCGACMVFILTWWTFWFLNRGCLILLRACELKWGVLMGASTIAAVFLLQLAISLPAIVVFPVAQGIALIGGVVLMALIYKERINKFKVIEAILGLMVIIQAVFR